MGARQSSPSSNQQKRQIPRWAKAGAAVEALWEGKWYDGSIISVKKSTGVCEVEWATGEINEIPIADVREATGGAPAAAEQDADGGWGSKVDLVAKRSKKEQERYERRKAQEREAAKEEKRQLRLRKARQEQEDRELEEARAARQRRAAGSPPPAAQDSQGFDASSAARLAAGLVALAVAAAGLAASAVIVAFGSIVAVLTAALPAAGLFLFAHLLRRVLPSAAGAPAAPSAKADVSPPRGKGAGKLTAKERRQLREEWDKEDEAELRKQRILIFRALLGLAVVVVLMAAAPFVLSQSAAGPDLYGTLMVDQNANSDEIIRNYKALSRKWHPDKHAGDQEEAQRMMALINEAKITLLDPERRAEYDAMRERTSHLSYREVDLTYGTQQHPWISAYSSCPEVMSAAAPALEASAGLICSPLLVAHLVLHPLAAYLAYAWANFGPVAHEWRRAAAIASGAGLLAGACSFACGMAMLGYGIDSYLRPFVILTAPFAAGYLVDKLLCVTEVTEKKKIVEGARPVVKVIRNSYLPDWVPRPLSLNALAELIGERWSGAMPETILVSTPDGDERLVGSCRTDEIQAIKRGEC